MQTETGAAARWQYDGPGFQQRLDITGSGGSDEDIPGGGRDDQSGFGMAVFTF